MRVAIAGGDGFIGAGVTKALQDMGDEVIWLSYRPGSRPTPEGVTEYHFDLQGIDNEWASALADSDAVINLSGSNLAVRWNPETKAMLLASRIDTARALINAIRSARESGRGPSVYLGACGIGIYGDRGDEVLTEESSLGSDWLSMLAQTWEQEGLAAADVGCRAVVVRTGLVLGTVGLMPKMLLPMKMFVGGPLMPGDQWMPWVHYDDIAGIYAWATHEPSVSGPINACAPNPQRSRDFSKALGQAAGRPSWFPVPVFALKLVLGEVAPYMVFSQRPSVDKIVSAGYRFKYPELLPALREVLTRF